MHVLRPNFTGHTDTATIYYSIPHNTSAKGVVPILSTLIAQLCHKHPNISPEILEIWFKNPLQAQKTPQILLDILRRIVLAGKFRKIYVILNATTADHVDEVDLGQLLKRMKRIDHGINGLILTNGTHKASGIDVFDLAVQKWSADHLICIADFLKEPIDDTACCHLFFLAGGVSSGR